MPRALDHLSLSIEGKGLPTSRGRITQCSLSFYMRKLLSLKLMARPLAEGRKAQLEFVPAIKPPLDHPQSLRDPVHWKYA